MTTYYERNKDKIKQQRRERYKTDAVYRAKQIQNSKQWRESNPSRMQEYRLTWTHSNPTWIMYHNARRRAVDASVPFDISYTDIHIPTHCPILGIELSNSTRETTPSLDRVIPELGYVLGNIQVISMRANRLKQDASIHELEKIVEYMKKNRL